MQLKKHPTLQKKKRRGSALVLAALFLLVLIPMVGLAVDGTNVYLMRNQIVNALDGAVLAGNRSLSLFPNVSTQISSAQAVALNTFNTSVAGLNLPALTPTFTVIATDTFITVTGSVTTSLPLMLMGIIRLNATPTFTVTATSQRRIVNTMLVLDNSEPMNPTNGNSLADMQADAINYVNMFVNGMDNIGLVTFTAAPFVAVLPNSNFQSNVPDAIYSMTAPNNTYTGTAAAMSVAYQQLQNFNRPGALNVIVLFTAGPAGAFTANFAGLVTSPTPCNPSTNPLIGGLWATQRSRGLPLVGGLTAFTSISVNDTPETSAAPGCTGFDSGSVGFLSAMPVVDYYGNSTIGTASIGEYAAVNLNMFNVQNVTWASENALDDAAYRIRSNGTLPTTIFVIGLGVPPYTPPDAVLMPRIANEPASPSYNSNQPTGQYIPASDAVDLQAAFKSIASQILRLAQ